MTALLLTRDRTAVSVPRVVLGGIAAIGLVLMGLQAIVLVGLLPIMALGGPIIIGLVLVHPQAATYVLLGLAPFVVGFDRDALLPLLRPSEALLFAVAFVLFLRWLVTDRRFNPHLTGIDLWMALLIVLGSVVPFLISFGRLKEVWLDELFYALQFWKLGLLYGLIRTNIRTPTEVRRACFSSLAAASVIGIITVAESMNIGGMAFILADYFPPSETVADDGRGSGTIGNPIGAAGYLAINLLLALALLRSGTRPRLLLVGAAGACLLGAVGTGQVTAVLALAAGIPALAWITRSVGLMFKLAIPGVALTALVLWPLIAQRIDGFTELGVPSERLVEISNLPVDEQSRARADIDPKSSWEARVDNLNVHFLPELKEPVNILVGVTPLPRKTAPEIYREYVYIESGYLWLVWVGGVPLVLAFIAFITSALRQFKAIARSRDDIFGAVSAAAFAAIVVLVVIQAADPHLTLRGTADAFYPLVALGLAATWTRHSTRTSQP